MKHMKIFKAIVVGVIVACAFVLVGFGLDVFGHSRYVVESGSMEPSIRTGSVVFDSRSTTYKAGDVITFLPIGSKDSVTHRIVSETTDGGETAYTVKGDANNAADPNPVPASTVLGKVSFSIPYIGYAVNAIRSLPGLIVLVIIPATIIIYQEFISMFRELVALRTRRRKTTVPVETETEEATTTQKMSRASLPVTAPPRRVPHRSGDIVVILVIIAASFTYMQATRASFSSDTGLTGITLQSGTDTTND